MSPTKRIRVLIIDDSALVRQVFSELLGSVRDIEVVGTAPDPLVARQMIKSLNPDVVTLDIEMPKMDGLAFLEKIMSLRPMPVVMVSSLTQAGADATVRALELGAVDYVAKPLLGLQQGFAELKDTLIEKVRLAATARVRPLPISTGGGGGKPVGTPVGLRTSERIVAIGASTGGVEALRELVCALPPDAPACLVVQHMPERFTSSFANRLNGIAAVQVMEAQDGQRVLPGHVYIAPGSMHLELVRSGANYMTRLNDGPLQSGHKPSVDILFQSVARAAGANAIGVILTGMGRDGAAGLLELRRSGAYTIGQDEASSVVYGMPKAAKEAGAVVVELSLGKIVGEILARCQEDGRALRI